MDPIAPLLLADSRDTVGRVTSVVASARAKGSVVDIARIVDQLVDDPDALAGAPKNS